MNARIEKKNSQHAVEVVHLQLVQVHRMPESFIGPHHQGQLRWQVMNPERRLEVSGYLMNVLGALQGKAGYNKKKLSCCIGR